MVNSKNNRPLASDPNCACACAHVRLRALYQPIARQQTSHASSSAACSSVEPCQHRQQWKLLYAIYGQTEPGPAQPSPTHTPPSLLQRKLMPHSCCSDNLGCCWVTQLGLVLNVCQVRLWYWGWACDPHNTSKLLAWLWLFFSFSSKLLSYSLFCCGHDLRWGSAVLASTIQSSL